jgi:hypothetical protein
MTERQEASPSPCFSQVFILKVVKVLCFDTLSQVFILNGLGVLGKWRGSIPLGLPSKLRASGVSGEPPYFITSLQSSFSRNRRLCGRPPTIPFKINLFTDHELTSMESICYRNHRGREVGPVPVHPLPYDSRRPMRDPPADLRGRCSAVAHRSGNPTIPAKLPKPQKAQNFLVFSHLPAFCVECSAAGCSTSVLSGIQSFLYPESYCPSDPSQIDCSFDQEAPL